MTNKFFAISIFILILSASFVSAGSAVGQFEITGKAVEEANQKLNNSDSITGKSIDEQDKQEKTTLFSIIKDFFKKIFDFFKK